MLSSNSIRVPLRWPNVDVFTFGESSIFGYDSANHCLLVQSHIDVNKPNEISIDQYHLSSSPTWSINRLILNPDETIIALLADKIAYLVYLPQQTSQPASVTTASNISPSKGSRLCPITRVPSSIPASSKLYCSLIDFVWLSSLHFVVVYSAPSASECHLYIVRPSKQHAIELVQTFPVGLSSSTKMGGSGTPNKKISLHQPSDIVKLDVGKRSKQTDCPALLLLFAMKADGDLFLMEIDQNELFTTEKTISSRFDGPLRLLPSTPDNYGASHAHSTFLCLSSSSSHSPLLVFTLDKCHLNQCIVLSSSDTYHCLFTIDSIDLSSPGSGQMITSMIPDPLSSNRYYVSDSVANVYSIEITWVNDIERGQKKLDATRVEHLMTGGNNNIKMNNRVEQMGLIQTTNKGQWLAMIVSLPTSQEKQLILLRPQSLSLIPTTNPSSSLVQQPKSSSSSSSSEFVDHIRSILHRDQSLPLINLASPSSNNISEADFETNLSKFISIFTRQYIEKQERARAELDNKQRYLFDLQQTQQVASQEFNERLNQLEHRVQTLMDKYQQERVRRDRLSSCVDDLLSVIEQRTPVVSDAEIYMHGQLERYRVQLACLADKVQRLSQFISSQSLNNNQQQMDNSSMQNIEKCVRHHQNQIDRMKKQLETMADKN